MRVSKRFTHDNKIGLLKYAPRHVRKERSGALAYPLLRTLARMFML
jgi:hypothetical protein